MIKAPPKHVYHVGDHVTVTNPLVVTRVGYPLGLRETAEQVEREFGSDIRGLMDKAGASGDIYDKMVETLAYGQLKAKGFGGPQRSIHTVVCEELRGVKCDIMGKRTVKTGTYHGVSRGGYDGEDYDPPYLSGGKTHVLLELMDDAMFGGKTMTVVGNLGLTCIEIEECNVEAVVTPAVVVEPVLSET